jgi:CRISPR system Cascade subunit CasD
MPKFLVLKLDGPMQAWGTHTFEDFRPSNLFPTRSGLLGLIGACLGLERSNHQGQERLAASVEFGVRVDYAAHRPERDQWAEKHAVKLTDFHTVLAARKVDGSANENPVVSRREYLFDAAFTVAVGEKPNAAYSLEVIAEALRCPCYTPVLGRRSCPLASPLFAGWQDGADAKEALSKVPPVGGVIYAEGVALANARPMTLRDVPAHHRHRSFGTRRVYVHVPKEE